MTILTIMLFSKATEEGSICWIAGWGVTDIDKSGWKKIPENLQEVEVPVVNLERCKVSYRKLDSNATVTDDHICAGAARKDSCFVRHLTYSRGNCVLIEVLYRVTLVDP